MSKKRQDNLGHAAAFRDHGLEVQRSGGAADESVFLCPECGKPKLYVNRENGCFHCKTCDFNGNVPKFLAWVVKRNNRVPKQQRIALHRERGIPFKAFKEAGVGWDEFEEQFTLPVYIGSAHPVDIGRWQLGGAVRRTSKCKAGLLFGDRLAAMKDRSVPVWVCEGEFDAIALRWLMRVAKRADVVVGVPGAGVFKDEWQPLFTSRLDVRLVYDNDEAGRKGAAKAWGLLRAVNATVRRIAWPPGTPEGFDARDWVVHGWKEYRDSFPDSCLGPLEKKLTDAPPEGTEGDAPALAVNVPSLVAAAFLERFPDTVNFHPAEARQPLRHRFNGTCFAPLTETTEQADVLRFLEEREGEVTDRTFNAARRALALLPEVAGPGWIGPPRADHDRPPAEECLLCQNGLLHVPTRTLHPATPAFFATSASGVAFDPDAEAPRFMGFLRSLDLDGSQRVLLRQIAGYLLVADNRHQKFFVFHGAPRGGKGTLARLFARLLGPELATQLSLVSLAHPHCEAALVGKRLCVFPDERGTLPQRAMTLFLQIVGGDEILINPKYQAPRSASLPTRFLLCTNDAAMHGEDAAGAVADRAVAVRFTKSFRDAQDPDLERDLREELSGILNWALDGFDDLTTKGGFAVTKQTREFAQESREAASPVLAWLAAKCDVGPAFRCECNAAFHSWRQWADANDVKTTNSRPTFSRDLKAALPGCGTVQTRGPRQYLGFRLRASKGGRFK